MKLMIDDTRGSAARMSVTDEHGKSVETIVDAQFATSRDGRSAAITVLTTGNALAGITEPVTEITYRGPIDIIYKRP